MSRDTTTGVAAGAHSHNGNTVSPQENGHTAPCATKPEVKSHLPSEESDFEDSYYPRNTDEKHNRLIQAWTYFDQEEQPPSDRISSLPPWVYFPDVERVEWLNQLVKQMWPYICQFVDKLFHDKIEPVVKESHAHLSTFHFSKIDLGDKPPRINGVKVYTEKVDKRQIIMDLQISFAGNTEIDVEIKRYNCKAGINSIQIHGLLRVVMKPLLGTLPLVGGLSLFFLKKPLLDIGWTGLSNILDIPGLSGFSRSLIQDVIYSHMVFPKNVSIPLTDEMDLDSLRFPIPEGVLRIHLIEARDLEAKDFVIGRMTLGKSDPYGVLQIGNQVFQSKTHPNTLNPQWNEYFEALIYEHTDQHLEVELYDEDSGKDDFLGRYVIDLTDLKQEKSMKDWFKLEDVETGEVHIEVEWLSLHTDKLGQEPPHICEHKRKGRTKLSSALLIIYLDSAKNLPSNLSEFTQDGLKQVSFFKALKPGKKSSFDPSPYVLFTVGDEVKESEIRHKTKDPLWDNCFSFLIHDPDTEIVKVEIKDNKLTLGYTEVLLSDLLEKENMELNENFKLQKSGNNSTIQLKMALRILSVDKKPSSNTASPAKSVSHAPTPPKPRRTSKLASQKRHSEPCPPHSASTLNICMSTSHKDLSYKESTTSLASNISLPITMDHRESQQNGSASGQFSMGQVQLTVEHNARRNKLFVVVHGCCNLTAMNGNVSNPYVCVYLLPDKSLKGRRKTNTVKRNCDPCYEKKFEFSVSAEDLRSRILDVEVKHRGGLLPKHISSLGKVQVHFDGEDISKGLTKWYDLNDADFSSGSVSTLLT